MRRVSCPKLLRVSLGAMLGVLPIACGRIGYELEGGPLVSMRGGAGGVTDGSPAGGGHLADATVAGGAGGQIIGPASGGADASSTGSGGSALDASPDALTDASSTDASGDAHPDADADANADACAPPASAPDYCLTIPELRAPPVIDGALDCGLTLRALVPVGWSAGAPIPADSTTEYAVAYRPDGLYFFLHVTDSTRIPPKAGEEVWRGDGVELYVDADGAFAAPPAFDNPGTRQVQVAAPADADAQSASAIGELYTWGFAGTRVPWTAPRFIAVPTLDGYVVEAFVTAEELPIPAWSLSAGSRVGMDIGINVSDPTDTTYEAGDGNRLGQYFLRLSSTGNPPPFFNVEAFCTPTLGG